MVFLFCWTRFLFGSGLGSTGVPLKSKDTVSFVFHTQFFSVNVKIFMLYVVLAIFMMVLCSAFWVFSLLLQNFEFFFSVIFVHGNEVLVNMFMIYIFFLFWVYFWTWLNLMVRFEDCWSSLNVIIGQSWIWGLCFCFISLYFMAKAIYLATLDGVVSLLVKWIGS